MKQNINKTDLEMLTEKGKERLKAWWKPKAGDKFYPGIQHEEDYLCTGCGANDCECPDAEYFDMGWDHEPLYHMPLLSIGQLIEFLGEDWNREAQAFFVTEDGGVFPNRYCGNDYLCDLLWVAVVEILNKE